MLTPEWQLAQDKVALARRRDQITPAQAEYCLGANEPRQCISRLHAYQRQNATPSFAAVMAAYEPQKPQPPKPKRMQQVLKVIVGLIIGVIACGFIGCGIGALVGYPSAGTGIGSVVGIIPGILLGLRLARK